MVGGLYSEKEIGSMRDAMNKEISLFLLCTSHPFQSSSHTNGCLAIDECSHFVGTTNFLRMRFEAQDIGISFLGRIVHVFIF